MRILRQIPPLPHPYIGIVGSPLLRFMAHCRGLPPIPISRCALPPGGGLPHVPCQIITASRCRPSMPKPPPHKPPSRPRGSFHFASCQPKGLATLQNENHPSLDRKSGVREPYLYGTHGCYAAPIKIRHSGLFVAYRTSTPFSPANRGYMC